MAANPFDLSGRVAVVTGGCGVIGGTVATGLAAAGARVVVLDRRREAAEAKAAELRESGADAVAYAADVLDEAQLREVRDEIVRSMGGVEILFNAAGGNVARARNDNSSIFEVPMEAFDEVLRLNLHGSVVPALIFAEAMAKAGKGSIVNISSMAAMRAMSGVLGYSVAKAGMDIFTKWLANEMARKHGDGVRVNAIAPGFFIGEQNRAVLINPDGSYTERARTVVSHTPMGRFGRPEELLGAVQWLCSDAASFVTGVVIPVDGGFSIFSGV
ncbi:MAG TPA: SDR family oxidoreductase [Longimicrobiaceae bacterium]|nr:SDR family oxidoreductase [Longimicrobiaceae bacterium]